MTTNPRRSKRRGLYAALSPAGYGKQTSAAVTNAVFAARATGIHLIVQIRGRPTVSTDPEGHSTVDDKCKGSDDDDNE